VSTMPNPWPNWPSWPNWHNWPNWPECSWASRASCTSRGNVAQLAPQARRGRALLPPPTPHPGPDRKARNLPVRGTNRLEGMIL
jgi:hypothetical protein